MYLKSLTLKGFKSFASATTLRLEPGITAVVGPNGSGKSNVVDAIAWVLGEQGAKALRGGKMEDVIFAGTAGRPPLGRAEVTLTIDNSDNALPIEYTEVSITRRMFRDGASEYEINGSHCRLLDIQELLSDSGIGREMHVIVGQGQLDAVLSARAEDRRAFIEEAAGVLKHRKRKEKALRKLDAMQANLTRITDLVGELRRQLRPLGRQAEVARRAAGIQADLRDAKLRLAADDYATLSQEIAKETADEQAVLARRDAAATALAAAAHQAEQAAAELAAATPALAAAQETWFAASALTERLRGTISLAAERAANLSTTAVEHTGRDPEELEAQAQAAEATHAEHAAAVAAARAELATASQHRTNAERQLAAAEKELLAATRAIADRREGLARLAGQVNTARSRLAAATEEITRLGAAVTDATERADTAHTAFEATRASVGELDSSEIDLDANHQRAENAADRAADRVRTLREELSAAHTERTGLSARAEALRLSLVRRDGTATVLDAQLAGVLGPLSELVTVQPGYQRAIAAALGGAADAVAVASLADAAAVLAHLRTVDGGRAHLVVPQQMADTAIVSTDLVRALDVVTADPGLAPALGHLLGSVVIADDDDADAAAARAIAVIAAHPDLTVATVTGEVFTATGATGGESAQSALEVQVALDQALDALAEVDRLIESRQAALTGATEQAEQLQAEVERTLAALHESDAAHNAVAERLAQLGQAARAARAEAQRLTDRRAQAETARESHRAALEDLEARLEAAEQTEAPAEADVSTRDDLAHRTAAARQVEVDSRLALRTAEERAQAAAGVAESLRRAARTEREARARAAAAARKRHAQAALARRVVDLGSRAAAHLETVLQQAQQNREKAAQDRQATEQRAQLARAETSKLQAEADALTDAAHRDEVLRAQQTLRMEQLCERIADEFALSPQDLLTEFGPDIPVPPSSLEMGEYEAAKERGEQVTTPQPMAFDRPTQQRRLQRAEKDLTVLGKVNPLALEEFAALQERHAYLSTQLEDLKATRKDLLDVVSEVDTRILDLFASAYQDVAREFVTVFATLFPGGEGELVLTDPDDMLATGVEVHARPPGKKVKRLSLLSGGERSLTAVAMLVAIFRARPSPFYVLDEVEAALDEVNLTRLVGLLTELRESSQLIVITHQKYTMEAADALYGVTMRGDGITEVISQRIRGLDQTASAAG